VLTQVLDDARHFCQRTGRRILVGRPQPRTQQLISTERCIAADS
jgi:hypothetical protein